MVIRGSVLISSFPTHEKAVMSSISVRDMLARPSKPVCVPSEEDWVATEERLGVALPIDYKVFVNEYGSGCIDEFIWVFNPKIRNPYLNLVKQADIALEALRSLNLSLPDSVPYPLYPEKPGLLPWGRSENSDVFFWYMGASDTLIVTHDSRVSRWEEHSATMTEFICKVLTRELVVRAFPPDFPDEEHTFRPVAG